MDKAKFIVMILNRLDPGCEAWCRQSKEDEYQVFGYDCSFTMCLDKNGLLTWNSKSVSAINLNMKWEDFLIYQDGVSKLENIGVRVVGHT